MPSLARLSQEQILSEARVLLELEGLPGLTMRALARRLGVSAPSLYFHVESREDLIRQVTAEGFAELGRRMDEVGSVGDPSARALLLGQVYITFAETHPQLFTLIFGPCEESAIDPAIGARAAAPLLAVAAELVGPDSALALAAGLWSLVHGYTVLRLAAQFRIDPDHQASFVFALDAMLAGARLANPAPAR